MPSGSDLIAAAREHLGVPYRIGPGVGKSPATGFDCSGLIWWAARELGVTIPHGSSAQIEYCTPISLEQARRTPGALLWRQDHDGLSTGAGVIEARRPVVAEGGWSDTYNGQPRWTRAGLIPGITYQEDAVTVINPVVGNTSPLRDAKTGLAVKGYGTRAPIRTSNGATTSPFHAGADVSAPEGTPIVAPFDGVVVERGWAGSGLAAGRSGMFVLLRSELLGRDFYAGHCSELVAKVGARMKAREMLALVGATGNVTGPHAHTEIRRAGTTTTEDPIAWFAAHGVTLGSPEEDDMPITDADAAKIASAVLNNADTILGGKTVHEVLRDLIGEVPKIRPDIATVHNTALAIPAATAKTLFATVVPRVGEGKNIRGEGLTLRALLANVEDWVIRILAARADAGELDVDDVVSAITTAAENAAAGLTAAVEEAAAEATAEMREGAVGAFEGIEIKTTVTHEKG